MTENNPPRLGVDLGGTKLEIVAIDDRGRELVRRRVPTPQGDYAATVEAVGRLVDEVEARLGFAGACTIGVGTPGSHSRASGRLRNSNSVWLNGRPLRDDLAARLARRVVVANDANCFALSEATDGAGTGAAIVFGVILGTGVGGGIVVDGRLIDGPNGITGEWGHNPLPWMRDDEHPGPPCYCGQRGCIETFLSGPGLAHDHAKSTRESRSPEAIVAGAAAGDPACTASLERYEDRLARSLAHIVNVLDPDLIVLGGGMSNVDRWYARVPQLWSRWVFSDRVDTRLVRHAHGDSSGVRGAAWLGATRYIPE